MVKQLAFELKKMFSDKATIVIILALVLISVISLFQGIDSQRLLDSKIMAYKSTYDSQIYSIENLKDDPAAKNMIKNMEESNQKLAAYFSAVDSGDKEAMLIAELEIEKGNLNDTLNGTLSGLPVNEIKKNVSELQYLVDHKIEQAYAYHISAPAINKVYDLLANFQLFLLLPLLFMVYVCTAERRNKNIAFANQVPQSLTKLAISRMIIQIGMGLILTLIPIVITYLFSLKNGTGSLLYPVVVSGTSSDIVISPMYVFLLKTCALILLSVFLVGLLIFLLSRISGNFFLISAVILGIVYLSSYRPIERSFLESKWQYFPWAYFDGFNIIRGGTMYEPLISPQMTFGMGLMVLTVCSVAVILLTVGIIGTRKKI